MVGGHDGTRAGGRFPLVDGVRGLAAAFVLLAHVSFWTGTSALDVPGALLARGDSGVAIFFVLSAMLLLRPWIVTGRLRAGGRATGSQIATRTYWIHRVVRVYPAYLLALVAVLVAAALLPEQTGGLGGLGKVVAHLFFLQGYTDDQYQAFTQTWSLTTEITFYGLCPVLGVVLGRLADRGDRAVFGALAGVALLGIVLQTLSTVWSRAGSHWAAGVLGRSVLGHLAWYAAGAAIAVVLTGPRERWQRLSSRPAACAAAALVVLLVMATPLGGPVDLHLPTPGQAALKEAAYAVLAGLLVLAAMGRPRGELAQAAIDTGVARCAGDLSYAVFLWQVLVLQLIYVTTGQPLLTGSFWLVLIAVSTITLMVAAVSSYLVEQPLLRWAHRRWPSARRPTPASPSRPVAR